MKSEDKLSNGFYNFSIIIWDYLIGNGLFLLFNIAIPMVFLFFKINNAFLMILTLYLLSLNLMPSFVALLYLYRKEDRKESILKTYIRGYKLSFKQAFRTGALMSFLIVIFLVDYLYFSKINEIVGIIFVVALLLAIVFSFSLANLISNFNFNSRQLFELMVVFFSKLNGPTLKSLGFLLAFFWMYFSGATITVWFMFAACAKIMVKASRKVMEEIYYFHTEEGLSEENPFLINADESL